MSRAVVKVDKFTWRPVERFDCVSDAAAEAGLTWRYVYTAATCRSLPRGRWAYRFADDFDPNERLGNRANEPVLVTDERTGRRYKAASIGIAADKLGVTYDMACGARRDGGLLLWRFRVERMF